MRRLLPTLTIVFWVAAILPAAAPAFAQDAAQDAVQRPTPLDEVLVACPSQTAGQRSLTQQGPHWTIDCLWPMAVAQPARVALNEFIRQTADDFRRDAEQPVPEGAPWTYSLTVRHQDFELPCRGLSTLLEVSTFLGGAHPATEFHGFTFLEDGRRVRLADLFAEPGPALRAIAPLAVERLEAMLRPTGMLDPEWLARGTAPEPGNYGAFACTPKGLLFVFQHYQVAPYAAGPQRVSIAWERLEPLLSPVGRQLAGLDGLDGIKATD
mgnify:CR=1 FL=1